MTKLPVKVLLDENKNPFVPYMTTKTIFYEDSDRPLADVLDILVNLINEKVATVFSYKGNVADYNALLTIADPVVGDVYNTLDDGKNYAWSGTNWDDLGGSIDLSSYYTKEETDQAINDALENVEVDLSDYYNKTEVDAAISDALDSVEVEVDLSDYYNKTEVDTAIDTAVSDLLHYVGHYDTAEGLPSTGQPSGTAIANYFTDTVDRLNLTGITLPNMRGYQYCFGFIDSSNPSNYCYVLTNNPEIITSVGIANGYAYQEIVIDATPEKPAALYNCYSGYTGPIYREIQSDGSYNYYPYGATNGYSATKKTWLYGAVASYRMFGVLGNHVIKFSDYGYTGYNRKQQDNSGYAFNSYYNQSMGSKSYSNTPRNEGYIYNAGMFFIKDAEGMAVSFVTADSIAQENDLATVGEMNNMYLCVAGPEWIPLAQPHDSYSKEEIDAMIGEVDNVLNEILGAELVQDDIEVPDVG